jgi:hypothetical protein
VYFNKNEKVASLNITAFKYIKVLNIHTIDNSFTKFSLNNKIVNMKKPSKNIDILLILRNINFTKVIQLGDFGIKNQNNCYIALLQNTITNTIYTYLGKSGSKIKLKNYLIINQEHGNINYYMKIVEVINLIVVLKILLLMVMENIKNVKIKK